MSRAEDKGKGKGCLDLGLLSVFFCHLVTVMFAFLLRWF